MSTDRTLLAKGVKFLFGSLPLLFIGPTVIYNALMNKHTNWHYVVLVVGCAICIIAVYVAFRGLKLITDSIFNDGK
jgi:putative effector of murein hydrolase LrgA (UPF0299 family)